MKNIIPNLASLILIAFISFSAHSQIFVNVAATGLNDGTSFTNGYNHLNTALANATSGSEIRIAQGIYYPDLGTGATPDDRNATFTIPDGVTVLGGYDPSSGARNVNTFIVRFSGEIQQNGDDTDNSYHIITIGGVIATIDGVIIERGYADASFPNSEGGGIYINTPSGYDLSINQCIFQNNYAQSGGSAIREFSGAYFGTGNININNTTFTLNESFNGGALKLGAYNTISNSTFSSNTARFGGAIYIDGGFSTFTNCAFTNNSIVSPGSGGAIYTRLKSNNFAKFVGCTFTNNSAPSREGGAITIETATGSGYRKGIEVEDCTFTENTAQFGAAIRADNADDIRIINSTFDSNIAGSSGGGIGIYALATGAQPFISGCTFTNNSASGVGGNGVYLQSTNAIVEDCLFDSNGSGGGFDGTIGFNGSSATINRCIITNNNASRIILFDTNGSPTISNSIFANNAGTLFTGNGSGSPILRLENNTIVNNNTIFQTLSTSKINVYNNIIWNINTAIGDPAGTVDFNIIEGGFVTGTNINSADPIFVDEAGGNYRLQAASPAIDSGNNAYATSPRDLDNNIRVENTSVDLGSYEFGASDCPTVTGGIIYVDESNTNNFELGTSWEFAFTKLQDAIAFHHSSCGPISEIRVAEGSYFPDEGLGIVNNNRNESFVIPTDITILGGFPSGGGVLGTRDFVANPSILSGDVGTVGNNGDNTYHVIKTQNVSANTIIDGFIIEKGIATTSTPGDRGGAWHNEVDGSGLTSEPQILNCVFRDNKASSYGGAIYNSGINGGTATMNFKNSQFIANATTSTVNGFGGGIYNEVRTNGTSQIDLVNCYFQGNDARFGGAIRSTGRDGGTGFIGMNIVNSIFYQNSANSVGGVYLFDIDNTSDNYQFINCTFYGNSSVSGSGSGITAGQSGVTVNVVNSIFKSNTGTSSILNNQISGVSGNELMYSHVEEFSGTFNNNSGANPLLVDGPNGDLRLQESSPAINTGLSSANTESNDIDGNARIIGPEIDRGAYEATTGALPEIEIQGNAVIVANGDVTPDLGDDTDFGTILATEIRTKTYTIFNNGGVVLNLTENTTGVGDFVAVTGAEEFTVTSQPSATIASGASSEFQITFTPDCGELNARIATVSLESDDPVNNPFIFDITAITDETASPEITCAADITIFTDPGQCSSTQAIGIPIANGCGTTTNNAPASFPLGITVVTWSIDNNGDIATCDQIITVVDDVNPTISCPVNIIVTNDPNTCGAIVTYTAPEGTDNCVGATTQQIQGMASGEVFPVGTTNNVFRVTDASGNTNTCSFTVTVNDTEPPVLNCENMTMALSQNGLLELNPYDILRGYTVSQEGAFAPIDISTTGTLVPLGDDDFSTVFPINFNFEYFNVPQNQFYISSNGYITFEDDGYSNEFIAFAASDLDPSDGGTIMYQTVGTAPNRILVVDFTDVPFYNDLNGAKVTTQLQLFETTNLIEIHSLRIDEPEDDDIAQGTFGNFSSITVPGRDFEVWSAMNDFVSFTPNGSSVSDNCWIDNINISQEVFDCSTIGENTINVTVTDGAGNMATCSFVLTIVDETAPIINCMDTSIALDSNGLATIIEADVLETLSTSYLFTDIGSFNPEDISGTGTTVSLNNNELSTSLPIEFNFNFYGNTYTNFYISSNGFITFNNDGDEGCCGGTFLPDNDDPNNLIALAWGFLSPEDSGVITYETIGTAPNRVLIIDFTDVAIMGPGAEVITSQVKLFEGSHLIEIHSETIGVSSFFPISQGIENSDGSQAVPVPGRNSDYWNTSNDFVAFVPNGGLTFDNCGIASTDINMTTFDCTNLGENIVTITSTDVNGNVTSCTSTVTVIDDLPPVITCQDFTAVLDANGMVTITGDDVDGGTVDGCDFTLSVSPDTFDCSQVNMTIPVTLTATDSSGNSSSCIANVTVQDNTPPTLSCQNITIQLDTTGNVSIVANDIVGSSTDACGIASLAIDNNVFDCSNIGLNDVTLTVTDVHGNFSSCVAVVTVQDIEDPTISCVPNTTRDANAGSCDYLVVGNEFDPTFTDNCDSTTSTNDFNNSNSLASEIFPLGDTTVNWTANDGNGNTATCTTVISVVDTTVPVAVCQNFTLELDAFGNGSIVGSNVDGGSTDACGNITLTVSPHTFDCTNIGANSVTLTVTDTNGNTDSCIAIVTIQDNVAPTAVCQDITVQLDENSNVNIVAGDVDGGSTDACGIDTLSIDIDTFDCSNVGTNNVTLTVTDVNGNSSSCIAIVTVEDNIAPLMNCPADFTVGTDAEGMCGANVSFAAPTPVDTCGIDTVGQTAGLPSGSVFPVGVSVIEYTATDVNGNTTTCSFTITVVDNDAPTAVCMDITIQLDAAGNATIVPADVDGGSTDNCAVDTLSIDVDTFTCADLGANNVLLTVTDTAGLTSTCTAIVTVEDITPPTVVCQDITVSLDATGTVTINPSLLDGGSTDSCGAGIFTYSATPDTFTCAELGDNTVTLTVTDENGNSATCDAIVTVEDDTAPTIVCQDITVQLEENGMVTIVATDLITSADDACGVATTAVDIDTFSCDDLGTSVIVTVAATDASGNSTTCTATVTIVDEAAPQFDTSSLPEDQVRVADESGEYILEDFTTDVIVTDNCSILDAAIVLGQDPAIGTVLTVGVYDITLSAEDDFGNLAEYVFELEVTKALSIGENSFDISSLTMYPNPATDYIILSNPQNIPLKEVSIYDVTGRLIKKIDASKTTSEVNIDVSELASATYMVLINTDAGQVTMQLVKE